MDILLQTDAICTKEHVYKALYASKQGDAPDPKILDQIIYLIRKKLRPHGIEIKFMIDKGYTMSDANKAKLDILMFKSEVENDNL